VNNEIPLSYGLLNLTLLINIRCRGYTSWNISNICNRGIYTVIETKLAWYHM